MKNKCLTLILVASLLFLEFLILKNPITDYVEIKTGSEEQLTRKLINLKYSHLWRQQSFGLIGENTTREYVEIILKKDRLRVSNWPFSKSPFKPIFELSYNEVKPSISVLYYLDMENITYYYQKDPELDSESVSMNDKGKTEFIEKTSHMSVNQIKEDIESARKDFLKSLNFVKEKRLERLRFILGFFTIFFSVMNLAIIRSVNRIDKKEKNVEDEDW